MPPAPRGPYRRLARQLREAALRATPTEAVDLDRLDRLVRVGALDVFQAQAILRHVLRTQHARANPARKAA